MNETIGRRQLLRRTAGAALATHALGSSIARAALTESPAAGTASVPAPGPLAQRPLGKTGLSLTDISFGSSRMSDPKLVRHAYDRGVTYFDTAEGYQSGESETAIGEALGGLPRDGIVITSKTKCGRSTTRKELEEALHGSLRRLRTDYVDVYMNHAVNDVARLQNPEWAEFMMRAKRDGKIRFAGMSGHGSDLVECLDYAIDNDLVEVILVAYNFGQDPDFIQSLTETLGFINAQPDLPRVLEKAHAKGIGTVAMKTLRGAKRNDMKPYEKDGATFAQAAFRWVLSNPNVDGLVISMKSIEQIDEYLAASGSGAPTRADRDLLELYAATAGAEYCNHGCNECTGSCPSHVPIAEVLRTRMYATHYEDLDYARADYARLSVDASACANCSGAPCRDACPNGLAIPRLTSSARQMLA